MSAGHERDWKTREEPIAPRLDAVGWKLGPATRSTRRTEDEETPEGRADYALWMDQKIVAVVEGRKVGSGAQNLLATAKRWRGLPAAAGVPFLYATDGRALWFLDARHPENRPRRVAGFHAPAALHELLSQDLDAATQRLLALPNDSGPLRPYQREANAEIEKALASRKREMLVAMAPGTGKTHVLVNQVHRLLKSGVARRVLVLVDRRALAAQAVRALSTFEIEKGLKFDLAYEVASTRFRIGDFGRDEHLQPKVLPASDLTHPKPGQLLVYVCTIQRMAINLLGAQAVFAGGEELVDEDLKRLEVPIHAFDVVVTDECHRSYTASEVSVWRDTLDHFDAIKIGLTATPAAHTTGYFKSLVSRYDYPQAVSDDVLVDYDVVPVDTGVHLKGLFLTDEERIPVIDPITRLRRRDRLHDERGLDTSDAERKITAPEPNRLVVEELKRRALEHEQTYGRFPKTLIFAANDLPGSSHADQLVSLCRAAFDSGAAFVEKITGRVDRPLQRIREFRNRANPGIAVTVDLLANGIDLPDLEFVVLLRPVKSRILFEQMLGRGTRRGERYPGKSHFTVFDGFGGDLLRYFEASTGITAEPPDTRPVAQVIEDIWANRDRALNLGALVKRLLRVDKEMTREAREQFGPAVPGGDVAKYAKGLPQALKADFVGSMMLLRNPRFQGLLFNEARPAPSTLRPSTGSGQSGFGIVAQDQGPRPRIEGSTKGKPARPEPVEGRSVAPVVPAISPPPLPHKPPRPAVAATPPTPAPEAPAVVYPKRGPIRTSWHAREPEAEGSKRDEYLAVFEKFVRDNPEQIKAIRILLDRPREWGPGPLTELKTKLNATPHRFTVEELQKAHKATYRRNRVDLISMVKHAADGKEPLLTASERVERALKRVVAQHTFTPDQEKWLDFIREHLRENLAIDEYAFDSVPIFTREGGSATVRKVFKQRLPELLHDLNEALVV
jgi:type I restriction enzyme R subunit